MTSMMSFAVVMFLLAILVHVFAGILRRSREGAICGRETQCQNVAVLRCSGQRSWHRYLRAKITIFQVFV